MPGRGCGISVKRSTGASASSTGFGVEHQDGGNLGGKVAMWVQ
jgi:hypothetical protein